MPEEVLSPEANIISILSSKVCSIVIIIATYCIVCTCVYRQCTWGICLWLILIKYCILTKSIIHISFPLSINNIILWRNQANQCIVICIFCDMSQYNNNMSYSPNYVPIVVVYLVMCASLNKFEKWQYYICVT